MTRNRYSWHLSSAVALAVLCGFPAIAQGAEGDWFPDFYEHRETNVVLQIEEFDDGLVAEVSYINALGENVCFDTRDFPYDGALNNGIFRIEADGVTVRYTGGYISYADDGHNWRPSPVEPGETLTDGVLLNRYYDIPDEYDVLRVRLTSYTQSCAGEDSSIGGGELIELISNRIDWRND